MHGKRVHLLLLDRLEDLDDALLVADDVDALEDLAILAAPDLAHHLIVVLVPAAQPSCSHHEPLEVVVPE